MLLKSVLKYSGLVFLSITFSNISLANTTSDTKIELPYYVGCNVLGEAIENAGNLSSELDELDRVVMKENISALFLPRLNEYALSADSSKELIFENSKINVSVSVASYTDAKGLEFLLRDDWDNLSSEEKTERTKEVRKMMSVSFRAIGVKSERFFKFADVTTQPAMEWEIDSNILNATLDINLPESEGNIGLGSYCYIRHI